MASRNMWIGVAIAIIVIVIVGSVVAYYSYYMPPSTAAFSGAIYEKDFAFGFSQNSLTSPGPTLQLTVNQSVTVTVYNQGPSSHNWAIVQNKSDAGAIMFGAQVGTVQNPIASGSSLSVTFTPNATGNYFYICQVPGHLDLGMYGNVVVTS